MGVLLPQRELRNTQKGRIGERSLRHCALYNFQNTEDDYPPCAAIISYLFEEQNKKKEKKKENRSEIHVVLFLSRIRYAQPLIFHEAFEMRAVREGN